MPFFSANTRLFGSSRTFKLFTTITYMVKMHSVNEKFSYVCVGALIERAKSWIIFLILMKLFLIGSKCPSGPICIRRKHVFQG